MPKGVYARTPEMLKSYSETQKRIWGSGDRKVPGRCAEGCTCGRHRPRTPESRQRVAESCRGKNVGKKYGPHPPERIEAYRQASLKLWRDEEYRRNIDRAHYRNSGYHAGVYMRCLNSEGVFAAQLDQAGIKWIYEPRRFHLSWCSYLPDFYLPEFDVWIEVKGFMSKEGQKKVDTFRRETGKTLVIVFQSDLDSMTYSKLLKCSDLGVDQN